MPVKKNKHTYLVQAQQQIIGASLVYEQNQIELKVAGKHDTLINSEPTEKVASLSAVPVRAKKSARSGKKKEMMRKVNRPSLAKKKRQPQIKHIKGESVNLLVNEVVSSINRHKVYPLQAKRRHHQGRVIISFIVKKDGAVSALKVIKSSGHAELDRAAILAVQRAQPFNKEKISLNKNKKILLPIKFSLAG